MDKRVIAIAGSAGSGKDTLADLLVERDGYRKASFAAALKVVVRNILGREINKATDRELLVDTGEYFKGIGIHEYPEKYKHLQPGLQIGRFLADKTHLYPYFYTQEFWARLLADSINDDSKWVVADMRFESELNSIKAIGGATLALYVPRRIREERLKARDGGFKPGIWEARSETEWRRLNYDHGIYADSTKTPDDIYQEVKKWLNS